MNKLLNTIAGAGLAGLAITSLATPSYAWGRHENPKSNVIVSYADLNVASPAGTKVLLRRITGAARRACGDEPDLRNLKAGMLYHACVSEAVDHAVTRANIPALVALYFKTRQIEIAGP